jgi:outer membrane protein
MQSQFLRASVSYLIILGGLACLSGGCAGDETHRPATNFVFRDVKISDPSPPIPTPKTAAKRPPAKLNRPEAPARLTLLEAVGHALRNNEKILVSSYNPPKAVQDLKGAEAVYDSSIFSSGNIGHTKRPTASLLDTGTILESKLIEDRWFFRGGTKKFLPSGATVSLYQELDRLNSNSILVVPDPQSTSRMVVEVSQPLLKGFWDRTNRAAIAIAKLNVDISNEEFRQTAMDVVTEVAKAYWQLLQEREFEHIAGQTLEMALEVHRREQVRLERGISTRLDTDRALAAAETRRGDLLRSQTRIKMISDQLKLLINLPEGSPEIMPVSKPLTKPSPIEMNKALEAAVKNRPELERAQKAMGVTKNRKDLAQHNRLPKLDAVFRYTKAGLGVNAGRAVDTVYANNNNSWLAGVEFEYPLGNEAPQAEYRKRSLEYDQSAMEARRVKNQVINEVTLAIREIHLSQKEIPTTLQAKTAAERVVESENARFELGQKTNEELLRAQDLWAAAAREYARAVINYNISLTSLGRAKGTILKELGIEIKG